MDWTRKVNPVTTNRQCSVVQLNLRSDVVTAGSVPRSELERLYKNQRNLIGQVCPSVTLPELPPHY